MRCVTQNQLLCTLEARWKNELRCVHTAHEGLYQRILINKPVIHFIQSSHIYIYNNTIRKTGVQPRMDHLTSHPPPTFNLLSFLLLSFTSTTPNPHPNNPLHSINPSPPSYNTSPSSPPSPASHPSPPPPSLSSTPPSSGLRT